MSMPPPAISFYKLLPLLFLYLPFSQSQSDENTTPICIVGSGIGGSSAAHFLRRYSAAPLGCIRVFERNAVVGGRMATVKVGGDTFEAGASILHPKNFHALNFSKLLSLKIREPSSSSFSLGIWDGKRFVFKTLNPETESPVLDKIASFVNSLKMLFRYGFSLFKMSSFVEGTVNNFLRYYEDFKVRPVFRTVEGMLKWSGLYNLTQKSLDKELVDAGLSPLLIEELVTVITRINYGQSVSISGLAGAVSLAGSGGGLWSIEGGNWQIAAGLIYHSDVSLHLNEEIVSIVNLGNYYELNSTRGKSYACEVTILATPLDELNIHFNPSVSIPERKLQHTHATFVRGNLNPAYFSLETASDVPELVGTLEDPDLPFSSISVLKRYNDDDVTYKIFSREPMSESLLNSIFSRRNDTIRINWGAYPYYSAPEVFAPFVLDGHQLYYINAFENAASTMETSAVAAENIVRLILSRLSIEGSSNLKSFRSDEEGRHVDL